MSRRSIVRTEPIVESPLLMFGAGFSVGVGATLLLVAVVSAGVQTGSVTLSGLFGSPEGRRLVGAAAVTIVLGSGLFLFAYRENRELLERYVERPSE